MIVLFALAFVLICISYLLMALLGVNAVRFAKNPDGVKARTGLAKLLIVFGAISLVSGIASMNEGATFSENMSLLYPSIVQTSFALSYLMEVKAIKSKSIACAQ